MHVGVKVVARCGGTDGTVHVVMLTERLLLWVAQGRPQWPMQHPRWCGVVCC